MKHPRFPIEISSGWDKFFKKPFQCKPYRSPPQVFTELSRAFFWRASSNPQKNGPSPKISWFWREGTYVFSFSIFNPCSRIISLSQNILMPQTSTHSTPAHEKSGWKLVHHSSLKKRSHTYNYKNLEQKIRVITDDPPLQHKQPLLFPADSTWARKEKWTLIFHSADCCILVMVYYNTPIIGLSIITYKP